MAGRPAGLTINRCAFEDLTRILCVSNASVVARSGVSKSHLSEIVNKGTGASRETAAKLADALGVNPATLFPALSRP